MINKMRMSLVRWCGGFLFDREIVWSMVGKIADKSFLKRIWFSLLDKIPEDKVFGYYQKMIRC